MSKIEERLRAHARLCRHMAEQTWDENAAARLARMADDCTRAANETPQDEPRIEASQAMDKRCGIAR